MDEIIKGLQELKDAIIYKGITDMHYIDLINSMVARAEKLKLPKMEHVPGAAAITPGIDTEVLDGLDRQGIQIAADNVTINFYQNPTNGDIPPTSEK